MEPGLVFHLLLVRLRAYYQGKYKDNEGNKHKLYAELAHTKLRSPKLSTDAFQSVGPGPIREGNKDRAQIVIEYLIYARLRMLHIREYYGNWQRLGKVRWCRPRADS